MVLFLGDKQQTANDPTRLPVTFKAIERWAGQLQTGGGTYASLTGPGQTTTPGDLNQAGGLSVITQPSTSVGIQLFSQDSGGIAIESQSSGPINILGSPGAGAITIEDQNNGSSFGSIIIETFKSGGTGVTISSGGATISINAGSGPVQVAGSPDRLGFYGTAGVVRPTVTGSRGGNAALQSLLNALNNNGLIADNTIP